VKILITGSSGFIGRNLLKYFEKDFEIYSPTSSELDLTDEKSVKEYLQNKFFDVVIHCAIKGGKRNIKDSKDVLSANLIMFNNIINNKSQFNNLINFTSGAELDRRYNIDLTNNDVINSKPIDYYGLSKNIISRKLLNYPNYYNLRVYGLFGVDEGENRFFSTAIKSIHENKSIEIFEDKYFDYFYILDLVTILEKIISSKTKNIPHSLDIVYKEKLLLSDIAKILIKKLNGRSEIIIKKNILGSSYIGKYSDAIKDLDLIGLDKGISQMINSFKY
jgi:GDP-L-fucose synthase